ncbi:hypothetical protein [Flavobacterium sp.]|jgi:hypothetical protein|uniref:hypothetical protein n=1 Tax=Flavobacterium sp. TaxID=239 RepID=UPI0037C1390D
MVTPILNTKTKNSQERIIESLFEKAEDYSKTSIELLKLNAIDKTADMVSSIITRLTLFAVTTLFIFVITIGVALWVGELLGKTYLGFFVMGGIHVTIALLIYTFRREWIEKPIRQFIIFGLYE